jgi:hypothetical protein
MYATYEVTMNVDGCRTVVHVQAVNAGAARQLAISQYNGCRVSVIETCMESNSALDQYNKIHKAGGWDWYEVDLDCLREQVRELLETWLVDYGIEFMVHEPVIGNIYVFKFGAHPVHYLICGKESYIWADENFANLDPYTAMAHILCHRARSVDVPAVKRTFALMDFERLKS